MEISIFNKDDDISSLIAEFNNSLNKLKYTPSIITEFDLSLFLNFYNDSKLTYIAKDDNDIVGMMLGYKYTPDDLEEFTWFHDPTNLIDSFIKKERILLEKRNYKKSIFYIERIESFKKKSGVGKTLIDFIKNDENIDIIFLRSINNSSVFYDKMGFRSFEKFVSETEYDSTCKMMVWNYVYNK